MVFVFYGHERQKHQALFDKLFRLRHEVFIVNRRWSLPCTGGTERDQYDTDDAVYLVDFDAQGEVLAHARLTPTMHSSLTAGAMRMSGSWTDCLPAPPTASAGPGTGWTSLISRKLMAMTRTDRANTPGLTAII